MSYYKDVIDWSKVKEGDPVEIEGKRLAYFKKYDNKLVFYVCNKDQNFISSGQSDLFRPLDKSCIKREVDWSKVPVDAKVILNYEGKIENAHFSHVDEHGRIYTFNCGKTSWTIRGKGAGWLNANEVELVEDENVSDL